MLCSNKNNSGDGETIELDSINPCWCFEPQLFIVVFGNDLLVQVSSSLKKRNFTIVSSVVACYTKVTIWLSHMQNFSIGTKVLMFGRQHEVDIFSYTHFASNLCALYIDCPLLWHLHIFHQQINLWYFKTEFLSGNLIKIALCGILLFILYSIIEKKTKKRAQRIHGEKTTEEIQIVSCCLTDLTKFQANNNICF